ncbi:MAG: ABC transporter substrate-binding protein, partial [Anaerolineae bacterium]|nr:ABC transporter substrate-binding protein [Anaerolineae bacterium]
MFKKLSVVLAVLMIASVLAPMMATAQDEQAFLRYPITPDPEHLNPFTAVTVATGEINRKIYEGLTVLNLNTGEPMPALAESWDISD